MTHTPEPDSERLWRMDITNEQADALTRISNTEAFRLIADERTGSLADHGYNPVDTLDAIWHELEAPTAHLYMQHGLTPHQAFLLDTNQQAQRNLWGPDHDTDRAHQLLNADIPAELIIASLLLAPTPDEAEALINTAVNQDPTTAGSEPLTEASTQPLDGLPEMVCDCADRD